MSHQDMAYSVVGRPDNREAMQYDGTSPSAQSIRHWIRGHGGFVSIEGFKLKVNTPEVTNKEVRAEDWVIHCGGNNFRIISHEMFLDFFVVT